MNTFIKISIFSGVTAIAFGAFAFVPAVNNIVDNFLQVEQVSAEVVVTGAGGIGCTDCGGTGGTPDTVIITEGGGGGGSTPNPPTCDITTNLAVAKDGDNYKLTWKVVSATPVNVYINDAHVEKTGSANYTFDAAYARDVFTLEAENAGGTCEDKVIIYRKDDTPKCVAFAANPTSFPYGGGTVKLTWETENATDVQIKNVTTGEVTDVAKLNNTTGRNFTVTDDTTYQLLVFGANGQKDTSCKATVNVGDPENPEPPSCPLTASSDTVVVDFDIIGKIRSDAGAANAYTDKESVALAAGNYKVTLVGWDGYHGRESVTQPNEKYFVSFFNGGTKVADSGSLSDLADRVTEATQINVVNSKLSIPSNVTAIQGVHTVYPDTSSPNSIVPICASFKRIADEPKAPQCVSFTANPNSLPYGGGQVTLTWDTENADSVTINNGVGSVSDDGNTQVNVTNDITYTMTVSKAGFNDVTCPASINVRDPQDDDISCGENVLVWKSNDYNVSKGSDITLTWQTTGLDSVSITDLGSVGLSGLDQVNINSDTTYVLTGRKDGETITCPISVDVESGGGGGGGGSVNPRCEFLASDKTITAGEEITLSWETKYGRDLTIYEGSEKNGDKIYETDDDDQVDEGSLKVRPTEDTIYTLVVERGSRDRDCEVKIDVKDGGVVINAQRSQGQIAGISLTQVPYTGFEAGPMLTLIFYTILALWGIFVAYFLVVRKDTVMGVSLAGAYPKHKVMNADVSTSASAYEPETSEAAAYVGSVLAPEATVETAPVATVPNNLPTGTAPVIGYSAAAAMVDETEVDTEAEEARQMKELEDHAHANHTLLSSDALRHFIAANPNEENRIAALTAVIEKAKVEFPSEDGWTVLNLNRLESLIEKKEEVAAVNIPAGAGSLAEAILVGNIAAAYQMIGHRPMVALADAAADLDTVYRSRNGEQVVMSDMLMRESARLETAQIADAIAALTGALDGTYEDEAGAVKMAILKATKATS